MRISTFRGEQGYEQMCDDILTTKTEMFEYANVDALLKVIGPYVAKDYLPRKHKLQIRTKFLYVDTLFARQFIQKNYVEKKGAAPMEAIFMDPREFTIDTFYVIYDDKLAIFAPQTLDGVIIQDKAIANSLRPFFFFMWNRAGKPVRNF